MESESRSSSTVNTMSYRPPSLILSPSKNDLSPESTPAARDAQWRVNGIGQLGLAQHDQIQPSNDPLEDSSPRDSSSTNSSISQVDQAARMSNAHSLHSRGSSTTSSTSVSQNLDMPPIPHQGLASPLSQDVMVGNISSRRPVSFSGGIPQSDLGRLQNLYTKGQPPSPISTLSRLDGPRTSPPRENLVDVWGDGKTMPTNSTPPRYPSLGDQPADFPSIHATSGDMMSPIGGSGSPVMVRNDMAGFTDGFDLTQRGMQGSLQAPFGGVTASRADAQYRLPIRTTVPATYAQQSPQNVLPASSGYMYPSQPRPPPLDRSQAAFATQQPYYDMVNSPPAMRRDNGMIQQRGTPLPTSPVPMFSPPVPGTGNDPNMRTPGTVPMMNGGMSPYMNMGVPTNGLFSPPPNSTSPIHGSFPPTFANANAQYYQQGAGFSPNDALATAMGRMTISPSFPTATQANYDESDTSSVTQNGPSANNRKLGLYKTELCRSWEEKGTCRYGAKCQFAHSENELRKVSRHPKYKTEICRTFWVSGSCPYGKRCCFIHTELPASGAPPGADGSSPPKISGGVLAERIPSAGSNRDRSTSNASGGEQQPISLLQRISAQRETSNIMSPNEQISPAGYHFSKPSSGSLRLDTTSLPGKTNYPLTSNPALASTEHQATGMSPILPATAGPDFGRQSAARNEVVGYNGSSVTNSQRASGLVGSSNSGNSGGKSGGRDSSLRHSFNGTEMGLSINSPVASSPNMALTPVTPDSANAQTPTGTTSGHQRAGSAGQWPTGSLNSRNNSSTHLASPSTLLSSNHSATTDRGAPSPWGPPEITPDRKRFSGTWL